MKAFDKLKQTEFSCALDAQTALEIFSKKLSMTMVQDGGVVDLPKYAKKGRPGKNKIPDRMIYRIEGKLASRVDVYQEKLQRKSCFIVATNELDEQKLSHERVIEIYKKDQQKVERGFRFLKDPLFMASTLFLKSVGRIMALMMVMTLCLLVYAAIEYRIRQGLKQKEQTFPDQLGNETARPTARWIFQFFSGIRLLIVGGARRIVLNMNEHHRALLALLGSRYVALYENSA